MVFLSAPASGGFYTSLAWGQHTHYAMIEYWRWWLVHLWVEGFFEVFATAVVALIFTRLGLVRADKRQPRHRCRDHRVPVRRHSRDGASPLLHRHADDGDAVGAVFSALEVVPLTLIGLEAMQTWRRSQAMAWLVPTSGRPVVRGRGVLEHVGAGLLGFAINPPASLYYVQGLNMTAAHGHAALFGVYGMLGIGLMLFACAASMSASCMPTAAEAGVLEPQHRPCHDGVPVVAARRHLPGVGQRDAGPVVRPLRRDRPFPRDGDPGLDARSGRHRVRRGRAILAAYAGRLLRCPASRAEPQIPTRLAHRQP